MSEFQGFGFKLRLSYVTNHHKRSHLDQPAWPMRCLLLHVDHVSASLLSQHSTTSPAATRLPGCSRLHSSDQTKCHERSHMPVSAPRQTRLHAFEAVVPGLSCLHALWLQQTTLLSCACVWQWSPCRPCNDSLVATALLGQVEPGSFLLGISCALCILTAVQPSRPS